MCYISLNGNVVRLLNLFLCLKNPSNTFSLVAVSQHDGKSLQSGVMTFNAFFPVNGPLLESFLIVLLSGVNPWAATVGTRKETASFCKLIPLLSPHASQILTHSETTVCLCCWDCILLYCVFVPRMWMGDKINLVEQPQQLSVVYE